jgi:hypothetical protein
MARRPFPAEAAKIGMSSAGMQHEWTPNASRGEQHHDSMLPALRYVVRKAAAAKHRNVRLDRLTLAMLGT